VYPENVDAWTKVEYNHVRETNIAVICVDVMEPKVPAVRLDLHLLNNIRRNVNERDHFVSPKHTDNYRQTLGGRIKEKRVDAGMTQAELARLLGKSRSNIAQYERNDSVPPMPVAAEMAKALNAPMSFFVDGKAGPEPRMPNADELGYALVEEVVHTGQTETQKSQQWALPTNWLRNEIGCADTTQVLMVKVEAGIGRYEYGDRVVIDTSPAGRRPSPPGTFLYWDGFAAALGEISVHPDPSGKKHVAKVTTTHGAYETVPDKLVILGRVKGVFKKAG
jgi:transcriptional regulator with XRE-family HTH domain